MNETRLKIIELIEPYMDKTVCNGFIYSHTQKSLIEWWSKSEWLNHWTNFSIIENEYEIPWYKNFITEDTEKRVASKKDYWHYDITALLKYIRYYSYIVKVWLMVLLIAIRLSR